MFIAVQFAVARLPGSPLGRFLGYATTFSKFNAAGLAIIASVGLAENAERAHVLSHDARGTDPIPRPHGMGPKGAGSPARYQRVSHRRLRGRENPWPQRCPGAGSTDRRS